MTDTIETVARAMADRLDLDWDGKAKGTEYANHGYWLPLSQAAITAHTAALIAGAGELERRLLAWVDSDDAGRRPDPTSLKRQAAATIAAQKAEIERLTKREAQAKLDGVRAGIEASAEACEAAVNKIPPGKIMERMACGLCFNNIRALDAAAIAKGEG